MLTKSPKSIALDEREGGGEQSPHARLLLSLDRLFKVGPYYPPGHAATRRVTSDFKNVMAHLLGQQDTLVFRMKAGVLHVQDEMLDDSWPGVLDFQTLLLQLGVDHLEIDGDASVEDLLTFVSRFLAFRNEVAGVKHFRHMKYDGLPPSVRIGEKQFRTGIALGSTGGEDQDQDGTFLLDEPEGLGGLDEILNEGADPGCVHGAETINEGIDAARESSADPTLDDARVVAAPPRLAENKKPVASGLGELIGGFESGQEQDIRSRALESVELMIQKLGRSKRSGRHADFLGTDTESAGERQTRTLQKMPGEQKDSPQEQPEKPKEVFLMSLPELRDALGEYAGKATEIEYGNEQDETEHLSIIFQMLMDKQPPDVLTSIERKLDLVFNRTLPPQEREVCVAGVQSLVTAEDEAARHRGLSLVLNRFRKARTESVIRLLDDVCERCHDESRNSLWPFVVNELLLGNDTDDLPCFHRLCLRAGEMDLEVMREQAPQLRKLPAMKKGLFSDDVLQPPLVELYPVFSVLLEAAHPGPIAVKLVRGLKLDPPGTIGESVMPLIDTYKHSYREFLVELLASGHRNRPPKSLLEIAGRVLANDLLALSPKRRGEEWVPGTIASLAEIPVPHAEKILKTITGRRFLFLINTWPKPCRNAARDTRKKIRLAALAAEAAREVAEDPDRAFTKLKSESDS